MSINYISDFRKLAPKCQRFIFLYFIRAISAGIAFYIGIYLAHIHMKWSVIGYEVSALSAGCLLGAWLASKLSDKYNPFVCSGYSLILQGICFLSIAYSSLPLLLGIAVFLYGASGYFYLSLNNYIITSYAGNSEQQRTQAISYSSVASNLGLFAGGVVVSCLTKVYATLAFTLVGIALVMAAYFYIVDKGDSSALKLSNETDETGSSQLIYSTTLFITFLLGCIFAQQRVGYQIFLESHFDGSQISGLIGLNTFLIIALLPSLTNHVMRFDKMRVMGFGCVILGLGMYLTILSNDYFFIVLLCVVRTIGEMIATVVSQYLCFQSSPKTARGKAMGQYKLTFAMGILVGSILGSNVLVHSGMNHVWELCGVIGLICIVTCLLVGFYKSTSNEGGLSIG